MKFGNKAKLAMLCSVFALATVGCDKLPGHQEKAPAAATVTQPVKAPEAAPPVAAAPVAQPAAPAAPEEPKIDERTFSNGEREGHVTKFSFKSSPVAKYMEG